MSRLSILAIGSAVYALFLGTFLYAIAFVGGGFGLVPKAIDDGASADLLTALAVNGGILLLFAVQHTIMARPAFKAWWTRIVPAPLERSLFVLATCAILIAMFAFWRPLPTVVWEVTDPVLRAVIWTVCGLGWALVLVSTFLIDHFGLFGLRQVWNHYRGVEPSPPHFQERSLYRWVRHPLLLGFVIAFWATPTMSVGHLLFAGLTLGYILVGHRIEERDLVKEHGDQYLAYRTRVPALVPRPTRRAPELPSVSTGAAA